MDKFIGNLTSVLDMEDTNIMIVSSPSFVEVSLPNDKVVNLETIAKIDDYLAIGRTPVISIKPKTGRYTLTKGYDRCTDT